ncbi:MAG: PAS domain S-box protein [Pirellulaceae bacterium]
MANDWQKMRASDDNPRRSTVGQNVEPDWLNVAMHSISDGIIATGRDGVIVYLNPVAESLTGWAADEAVGQPLESVFHIINEETRQPLISPVSRAVREGESLEFGNHVLLVAKNGVERAISDGVAPIRDDKGRILGVVVVFKDISEDRRTEREKQEMFDYTQDILDTLRHPFLVLDNDLRVHSANRSFYRSFQTAPQTTLNQQVFDLGNGQWNIPALRSLLEEILPRDTTFDDFQIEHDFPSIGQRIMLLNARRINRGEKAHLILLGIEDVTENRRLERERKRLETSFTSVVKNVRDHAIFTTDPTGHIISWNVAAEGILGYAEEEILGKHFSLIFTEQDIEDGTPEFELSTALETGRAEDERWHKKKGDELFWALGIVSPIYALDGTHTGFSKILRDITERKRMEEALREADRRKNEFLAMLSHELRNPLSPILNSVQLLGLNHENAETRQLAVEIIERQVKHLTRLVDDLLDISRITTGRFRLRTSCVCLNHVLDQVVERTRPMVERKRQRLVVSVPEQRIWLDGDEARLEQIFDNLINNASKYTDDEGEIELCVACDDAQLTVEVRDNGIGMAPELLPQIFDMFSQADESLERSEGGLGIGLALVKKLVEMHGGTIEVRSEGLETGSTFRVNLPTTPAPSAIPQEPVAAEPKVREPKSLRILVVDDNVDAAEMVSLLLRLWGHEIRMAYNGPDAIERALEFDPHAIFLDIGLPGLDGFEVAKRIRRTPQLAHVRLAAMTGYGQEEDRAKSSEAGFDAHLVKPVDSSVLESVLAEITG